jgi:hypothetical protein
MGMVDIFENLVEFELHTVAYDFSTLQLFFYSPRAQEELRTEEAWQKALAVLGQHGTWASGRATDKPLPQTTQARCEMTHLIR